ncbi:hypothetical protein GGD61_001008 [Bradyrhizobium sp. SBR1B]|nr:hypothetical protein [Bradyrhizobium sp. SBR1B]
MVRTAASTSDEVRTGLKEAKQISPENDRRVLESGAEPTMASKSYPAAGAQPEVRSG